MSLGQVDPSTGCGEALPVTSEEAQVSYEVLEETGLGGDEEVEEDAVVEGDALKQEQEVAVRVTAAAARRLQRHLVVPARGPPAGDTEQQTSVNYSFSGSE